MNRLILFIIICMTAISCREEIIQPDNFVGNINEPVQLSDRNSYSFLLHAENFSMNLTVPATFSTLRTRFNVTLIDYLSGYANIIVKDPGSVERFRYFIASDISYDTELLDGYLPSSITIRTENFTGKIKIEFRRTL